MTLHSVHSLELLELHAFSLYQNDDPLTQCLCSLGASVEIVSSLLFKTSAANVIVVASQKVVKIQWRVVLFPQNSNIVRQDLKN